MSFWFAGFVGVTFSLLLWLVFMLFGWVAFVCTMVASILSALFAHALVSNIRIDEKK